MCKALSQVITTAVSPIRDSSEQHLGPTNDRVCFADDTMEANCPRADSLLVYVKLQVNSEGKLKEDRDKNYVGECSMDACEECPATM